jgi:polyferredoxin
VRLRSIRLLTLLLMVGLVLVYALMTRDRLEVSVLHDRNPQYVVLSDGSIRNGYTLKLLNKIPEPRTVFVTMQGLRGGGMSVVGLNQPEDRAFAVMLDPDRLRTLKVYVRQPREHVAGRAQNFSFIVEDRSSLDTARYLTSFEAPE